MIWIQIYVFDFLYSFSHLNKNLNLSNLIERQQEQQALQPQP